MAYCTQVTGHSGLQVGRKGDTDAQGAAVPRRAVPHAHAGHAGLGTLGPGPSSEGRAGVPLSQSVQLFPLSRSLALPLTFHWPGCPRGDVQAAETRRRGRRGFPSASPPLYEGSGDERSLRDHVTTAAQGCSGMVQERTSWARAALAMWGMASNQAVTLTGVLKPSRLDSTRKHITLRLA